MLAATAGVVSGCDTAGPSSRSTPTGATTSVATNGPPHPTATTRAATTVPVAPPETPTDTVPATAQSPTVIAAQLRPYRQPPLTTVPAPAPHDTITGLAGGNGLALTVDDGTDSTVVAAYAAFLRATGIRLTFFVNGDNPSWTDNAAALRPMVESGQVQLGNHTWSHPDLRELSDSGIADELTRNATFLANTYGIDARPFYRPPFGFHNHRVDRVAAEEGYTTPTLWYGSLADSGVLSETTLLQLADTWIKPGAIVIGHANHPTVTHLFPQLVDIIRSRGLHTVTLADVYPPR